jgi:type VI secretion system protein ImpL
MKESLRLTKREAEEAWVLGNEAVTFSPMEIEKITGDVRELYLAEYIQQWDGLLNDLEVAPFSSMSQAVNVLDTLSAPSSPMRGILQAVERNTRLNRGPGGMLGGLADKAGAALEQKADAAVDAEKARLARLMQGAAPSGVDVNLPSVEGPGSKVERHFERINGVVASPGGAPPIDGILNVLSEVYGYLGSMAGSGNAAEAMRGRTSGGSDAIRRLQIEAARQPEPLKRWLQSLAQNSVGVMMGGTRSQLNAAYQSMVVPHCTRGLNNRYPLERGAGQEVNLSDFGRFFGPGGVMDEFFQSTLKPFVDTSRRTWAWKSSDGQSLGLSNAVLQQFQRAALIQEMFFADGGQRPLVRFGLKPVFLDANVSQFMIDLDGQRFTYRHGPTVVSNAQWPGPDGSTQTRIEFEELGGGRVSDSADGPWAWFRILDKAKVSSGSRDRLEVTFDINGRKAVYELRANSVVNPFLRQELESFRCPSSL